MRFQRRSGKTIPPDSVWLDEMPSLHVLWATTKGLRMDRWQKYLVFVFSFDMEVTPGKTDML